MLSGGGFTAAIHAVEEIGLQHDDFSILEHAVNEMHLEHYGANDRGHVISLL